MDSLDLDSLDMDVIKGAYDDYDSSDGSDYDASYDPVTIHRHICTRGEREWILGFWEREQD